MTAPLHPLAVAWVVLAALALWPRRPRRALRPRAAPAATRRGPLTRIGAALRRLTGSPDADADRAVGGLVVVALALVPLVPPLVPVPLLAAALAPRLQRRRRARVAADATAAAVPDAVDLFGLALAAGLTVPAALPVVGPRVAAPLGADLVEADLRARHGEPLAEALARVGAARPATRPLVGLLVAAHRDGVAVAEPLARLAEEQRTARRRAAEAEARQVPVRLLFPLVCCTLPAFGLLTVVPPVVVALRDLRS
ncbi:type II secretion system F family protein [Iamia majanohamensis]|uniref:Type II secretion system F family protein n=1 Tax=Iamia majanohamensis TaxID=467976 RepID=A0AAF0BVL6_9ACTN|nr:type II secretion system F family protein [Iamia majanohamensis]WCO66504.1 type II secretion system F family protein [Iamia majanohamensis]